MTSWRTALDLLDVASWLNCRFSGAQESFVLYLDVLHDAVDQGLGLVRDGGLQLLEERRYYGICVDLQVLSQINTQLILSGLLIH